MYVVSKASLRGVVSLESRHDATGPLFFYFNWRRQMLFFLDIFVRFTTYKKHAFTAYRCSDNKGEDSNDDDGEDIVVDLFNACSDDVVVCLHWPSLLVVDGGGGPDHHQVGGEDVSSFVRCTHVTWDGQQIQTTCKFGRKTDFQCRSKWREWGLRSIKSPGMKFSLFLSPPPAQSQHSSRLGPSLSRKRL